MVKIKSKVGKTGKKLSSKSANLKSSFKVKLFPFKFSGKGTIDPELLDRVIIQVRDERLKREREAAASKVGS